MDISGKVLRQLPISTTDSEVELDMHEVAAGVYFIKLSDKDMFETRKVVKQ